MPVSCKDVSIVVLERVVRALLGLLQTTGQKRAKSCQCRDVRRIENQLVDKDIEDVGASLLPLKRCRFTKLGLWGCAADKSGRERSKRVYASLAVFLVLYIILMGVTPWTAYSCLGLETCNTCNVPPSSTTCKAGHMGPCLKRLNDLLCCRTRVIIDRGHYHSPGKVSPCTSRALEEHGSIRRQC